MLTISRFEPYRDLVALQNRMNRFFTDAVAPEADGFGAWLPPVDIVEEADRLVFRAELPGVRREDIEVKIENGTLSIRGEKRQEKESGTGSTHRVERLYGSFHRTFALPTSLDAEKVQARFKDGVLELELPKAAEARPRHIAIKES